MGSGVVSLIVVLAVAGITSALVSFIRAFASRRGVLGAPDQLPRGGGLAIVVVTLTAWLLLATLYTKNEWGPWVFIVGAAVIAGSGLVDDVSGVTRSARVFVHLAVALFVVATLGAPPIRVPLIQEIALVWVVWPLWVVWLTGLTNAYKCMVGVDGIASQQALFAGLVWGGLGIAVNNAFLQLSGVCLVGGALGFIRHEWPPARIFMGAVGTTFLGFTLATLGLYGALLAPRFAWTGCLLVWPFAFDSVFSGLRAIARGMPISGATRVHLHQRLVATGMSHRNVTLLFGVMSLLCALTAGGWATSYGIAAEIAAVAVPAVVACVMWLTTVVRERRRPRENATVSPS